VAVLHSGEVLVAGGYDVRIQLTRATGLHDPGRVGAKPRPADKAKKLSPYAIRRSERDEAFKQLEEVGIFVVGLKGPIEIALKHFA
jgi:hypothetical protein